MLFIRISLARRSADDTEIINTVPGKIEGKQPSGQSLKWWDQAAENLAAPVNVPLHLAKDRVRCR